MRLVDKNAAPQLKVAGLEAFRDSDVLIGQRNPRGFARVLELTGRLGLFLFHFQGFSYKCLR